MIELRKFERQDFSQLIDWITSPEFLLQWGGANFDFPLTEEQLEKYLSETTGEEPAILAFTVVHQKTGNAIGHISLAKIDRKNKSARVGRVLVGDESVRGQGIGQQMMNKIVQIGFDGLQLHRVTLGVYDFNKPAIACYEKVGFKKEGLLRDVSRINGGYWSLWEMSMLEDEWAKKKEENKKQDNG
ncbi:GNAT family N-acetyltransferase [Planococcus salinus]|uniref:N-acetyltransferase n=1 Tax=Planococcus salinus TaxID=1848460 RepID=A0A3M8PAY8_9BACL|nr:GNAT family protein [Planococcus salinus]RNF40782.1 N-acetyltransferase [Planococcus salinus]